MRKVISVDEIIDHIEEVDTGEKKPVEKKREPVEVPKAVEPVKKQTPPVEAVAVAEPVKTVQQQLKVNVKEPPVPVEPVDVEPVEPPPVSVEKHVQTADVEEDVADMLIEEELHTVPPKLVIVIYGDKGEGKTTTAMSFRDRVLVLSFDDKSAIVKYNYYNNDQRIRVFSPIRSWDKSDRDKIPENAKKLWVAMLRFLDKMGTEWRPDWIVVDAVEEFERLLEQVMRYDYGLGPYDGVANRNVWKYRRDLFQTFISKALNNARLGVIFTTYPEYSEHISQGEVISRKQVPKWASYLQLITDVVLYAFIDDRTGDYKVKVITSKLDKAFPSGRTFRVTGTDLWTVLNLDSFFKPSNPNP